MKKQAFLLILSFLLLIPTFGQDQSITIEGSCKKLEPASDYFENGKRYTVSFKYSHKALKSKIKENFYLFKNAIKDFTFEYNRGEYFGTIKKADLILFKGDSNDATRTLSMINLEGVDMPDINGLPYISDTPLYLEIESDTETKNLKLPKKFNKSTLDGAMTSISLRWGELKDGVPLIWFYDEIDDIF